MYDKANVCRIANQLIKEDYTRSDAFVAAWQIEKNRVANISVQAPAQEVATNDTNTDTMTEQVRKYKELQAAIEELQAQADAVKSEIIESMDGAEEVKVDIFKVRYTTVVSNRFDTTEFKKTNSELYNSYLKENVCKRFTIAV